MKKHFSSIIANDDLCSYFASSIKTNSLSHAFILLGAKGTGKHTLARLVAAALNCRDKHDNDATLPCLMCDSCKKIADDNSADVIFISREKDRATLGVEAVRFIKESITFYPNDGEYKVYIIEDAHTMTVQAQNALLLTLEEPPKYAVFILLCENTESILETIRSRAPILRMKTPSEDEAIDFIKQNHPSARSFINNSPEEFKQIYLAANGSMGRILELVSSGEKKQVLQSRELTQKLIEAIANGTVARDFAEISTMFTQKRDERERVISQLLEIQSALRDLVAIKKADNAKMMFFTSSDHAEELSYSFSLQRLSDIMQNAEKARIALLRNANVKLTVMNFLGALI